MTNQSDYSTNVTLIARLSDAGDQEAWSSFVDQYSPLIYWWCTRFNLQDSEAADVTQEVLVKIVALMQDHVYDSERGGFRAWLKTITANLVRDVKKATLRRTNLTGTTQAPGWLAKIADPAGLKDLAELIESGYERELLKIASARVKKRVQSHTWKIYKTTALESLPAAQVAQELGVTVGDVYVAKSRVIKMLRTEIANFDREQA